jgi:hypothetical protein
VNYKFSPCLGVGEFLLFDVFLNIFYLKNIKLIFFYYYVNVLISIKKLIYFQVKKYFFKKLYIIIPNTYDLDLNDWKKKGVGS